MFQFLKTPLSGYAAWTISTLMLIAGTMSGYFGNEAVNSLSTPTMDVPTEVHGKAGHPIVIPATVPQGNIDWTGPATSSTDLSAIGTTAIFSADEPGTYTITARSAGHKKFVRKDVKVIVDGAPVPPVPPGPGPGPGPAPTPVPVGSKLYVSFITDLDNPQPAIQALIDSPTIRAALDKAGHTFHAYGAGSAHQKPAGFDALVEASGGAPAVIFQVKGDKSGKPVPDGKAQKLPTTEQGFLDLLKKIGG